MGFADCTLVFSTDLFKVFHRLSGGFLPGAENPLRVFFQPTLLKCFLLVHCIHVFIELMLAAAAKKGMDRDQGYERHPRL